MMKTYILLLLLASVTIFGACNDDFLERAPINSQTEATAFKTYENFRTYAWSMYPIFSNTGVGSQGIDQSHYRSRGDNWAAYFNGNGPENRNQYAWNTAQIPASDKGWSFSEIRRVNIMLQNIDKSSMSDADKAHWEGVGRFFRAYNYVELISRYGDVPWLGRAATSENDTEIVYADRTPRVTVADNIVKDLEFAIANINYRSDDQESDNTVNANCVKVMLSRFGLFEATWRKYHAIDESSAEFSAADLLDKAAVASRELITAFPTLLPYYNSRILDLNLKGANGIILYRDYDGIESFQIMARVERSTSNAYETHKSIVDMYLCKDGTPIGNKDEYNKKSVYHEFRNRDPRLLMTIVPPYFDQSRSGGVKFTPPAELGIDPMEYQDVMVELNPNDKWTRLPIKNHNGVNTLYSAPNIQGIVHGVTKSMTGYTFSKNWTEDGTGERGANDKPIFYIEEVMLNYAEIMFELGRFDQNVADLTINPLRKRADVADMKVASINESFDPNRDSSVDPMLWEIRRERMVELMGEGFGFNDIRRWKKANWFIDRPLLGVYMRHSDYSNASGDVHPKFKKIVLTLDGNPNPTLSEGYVYRQPNPTITGNGWKDAYYLFPIPFTEISLNPKLEQNPGWDEL